MLPVVYIIYSVLRGLRTNGASVCVSFHIFKDTGQMTPNNKILESGPNNTCEYV